MLIDTLFLWNSIFPITCVKKISAIWGCYILSHLPAPHFSWFCWNLPPILYLNKMLQNYHILWLLMTQWVTNRFWRSFYKIFICDSLRCGISRYFLQIHAYCELHHKIAKLKSHAHTWLHIRTCAICVRKGFQNVCTMCVWASFLFSVRGPITILHVKNGKIKQISDFFGNKDYFPCFSMLFHSPTLAWLC